MDKKFTQSSFSFFLTVGSFSVPSSKLFRNEKDLISNFLFLCSKYRVMNSGKFYDLCRSMGIVQTITEISVFRVNRDFQIKWIIYSEREHIYPRVYLLRWEFYQGQENGYCEIKWQQSVAILWSKLNLLRQIRNSGLLCKNIRST